MHVILGLTAYKPLACPRPNYIWIGANRSAVDKLWPVSTRRKELPFLCHCSGLISGVRRVLKDTWSYGLCTEPHSQHLTASSLILLEERKPEKPWKCHAHQKMNSCKLCSVIPYVLAWKWYYTKRLLTQQCCKRKVSPKRYDGKTLIEPESSLL